MDGKKTLEIKAHLLRMRNEILNGAFFKATDDLHVTSDDLADEADLASNVISQQVSFSIRHRELRKLREIEAALQRMEDGVYGVCLDCDETIDDVRLKNQPWTALCIVHAEERERENMKVFRS